MTASFSWIGYLVLYGGVAADGMRTSCSDVLFFRCHRIQSIIRRAVTRIPKIVPRTMLAISPPWKTEEVLAVDGVEVDDWGMVEDVRVFAKVERVEDDGINIDVVDDEKLVRAFWFHVTALGCVGSWLIVKIGPKIFWWLPSGSM